MRFAYPLAILCLVLSTGTPMAQDAKPAAPPAASDWNGPVVAGRHRQPTDAEIQARQREDGQSAQAIQDRDRKEDQVIDELYKELMTPPPVSEQSTAPMR